MHWLKSLNIYMPTVAKVWISYYGMFIGHSIPFFSIQRCGRQFSKFIFGPEKQEFQGGGGWHQKSPLGNQFSRYDPSAKLTPTGPNRHHPSGKLVPDPLGKAILVFDSLGKCFWYTPREFAFHTLYG